MRRLIGNKDSVRFRARGAIERAESKIMKLRQTEMLLVQRQDRQPQGVTLASVLEKRRLDQALQRQGNCRLRRCVVFTGSRLDSSAWLSRLSRGDLLEGFHPVAHWQKWI